MHLTRDELQRWWEHGAPADRSRVVGHLAECDACGALYAEIMDAQPVSPLREAADPRLVARAYRVRGPRWRAFTHLPVLWPRLLVGAAATVLVALVVPWSQVFGPRSEAEGIRGSTLQPISPIGVVEPPVRFAWASPVRTARYAVDVRSADGRLIVHFSTPGDRFDLGRDDQARLESGRSYAWQVVAFDAEGQEIMRAPPREFVMRSTTP